MSAIAGETWKALAGQWQRIAVKFPHELDVLTRPRLVEGGLLMHMGNSTQGNNQHLSFGVLESGEVWTRAVDDSPADIKVLDTSSPGWRKLGPIGDSQTAAKILGVLQIQGHAEMQFTLSRLAALQASDLGGGADMWPANAALPKFWRPQPRGQGAQGGKIATHGLE